MKFLVPLMSLFVLSTANARQMTENLAKAQTPPLPELEGRAILNRPVECEKECDKTKLEGMIEYRKALIKDLYRLKGQHTEAVESGEAKKAKELDQTFQLATIRYLEVHGKVLEEMVAKDSEEIGDLKAALAKCSTEKPQPKVVDDSNRSFLDTMKNIFNFERKDAPASVEDRSTIAK